MADYFTKEVFALAAIAVILVTAILCGYRWLIQRDLSILRKWAEENKFEVLSSERRNPGSGPFSYWSGPKKTVYFIKVRDEYEKERSGWVRFGSFWGGTLDSTKAEVMWNS
jgi:hypothetical protein